MNTTSKVNIFIAIAFTLIFLIVVLWSVDTTKAQNALSTAQWVYFVPMFALYGIGHVLRTFRLWTLMERQGGGFLEYFSINSIGFLGINVIPLRLGEFLRPHLFHQKLQIRHHYPFCRFQLGEKLFVQNDWKL